MFLAFGYGCNGFNIDPYARVCRFDFIYRVPYITLDFVQIIGKEIIHTQHKKDFFSSAELNAVFDKHFLPVVFRVDFVLELW